MKLSTSSPLVFKYLDLPMGLGARGGVQRFFLLSQGIDFEETLIAYPSAWPAEKERLVSSNENPSGTVPVLYSKKSPAESRNKKEDDEAVPLTQHIAASRLIARVYGLTSGDAYQDYVQDLIADEYQGFRDTWVHVSFEASSEEKAKYVQETLPKLLVKFNSLYNKFKTHETFMSVSEKTHQPLWGDAAMFGLLRDNIIMGQLRREDLDQEYPALATMYQAYASIPAIQAWMEKKEAALAGNN